MFHFKLEEQRIRSEKQKLQRLIKIAKPTALPFLTSSGSSASANKEQESNAAKKLLPMIGKRNQFSKFKVVKAVSTSRPKVQTKVFESDDEEVEEDEEEIQTDVVTKQSSSEDSKDIKPTDKSEVDSNNLIATTDAIIKCSVVKSIETTSEVPTATIETPTDIADPQPQTDTAASSERSTEDQSAEEAAHRKRRQRARQRNKQRQDVDMDVNELAEHEDGEKYAKWVPPTNQSGAVIRLTY